jgi:hypothetical protein
MLNSYYQYRGIMMNVSFAGGGLLNTLKAKAANAVKPNETETSLAQQEVTYPVGSAYPG